MYFSSTGSIQLPTVQENIPLGLKK